jgi:hypothetical protein
MRFDDADNDMHSIVHPSTGGAKHFEGLADAWSRAEEDFQTATRRLLR